MPAQKKKVVPINLFKQEPEDEESPNKKVDKKAASQKAGVSQKTAASQKKDDKEVGADGDKKKITRQRKKHPAMPYAVPLHRVLKQVNSEAKIMKSTVAVLDAFFQDFYDKVMVEVGHLMQYSKRRAVKANDIEAAVRLILPGGLAMDAVNEGRRAVQTYKGFMKAKKEAEKKTKMQVDAEETRASITIDETA